MTTAKMSYRYVGSELLPPVHFHQRSLSNQWE